MFYSHSDSLPSQVRQPKSTSDLMLPSWKHASIAHERRKPEVCSEVSLGNKQLLATRRGNFARRKKLCNQDKLTARGDRKEPQTKETLCIHVSSNKPLRLPQVDFNRLSEEAARNLASIQRESAMKEFVSTCRVGRKQKLNQTASLKTSSIDCEVKHAKTLSSPRKKLDSQWSTDPPTQIPIAQHQLLLQAAENARFGQEATQRLQACAFLLNTALQPEHQHQIVQMDDVMRVLLELAVLGQVCVKRDALFRWPRALCRQSAVQALTILCQNMKNEFVRREAIRKGSVVSICRSASEPTPAPLIFQTRYERIDSETYAMVVRTLKLLSQEELLRSLIIAKYSTVEVQELLNSELDRRASNALQKAQKKDMLDYCASLQRNKRLAIEERLLAVKIEQKTRTGGFGKALLVSKSSSSQGDVLSSFTTPEIFFLCEEEPPNLEEEALAVAKLAAIDAQKAKDLQDKLDKERAIREREEQLIRNQVIGALDHIIFKIEARVYSRQVLVEEVLTSGVYSAIENIEFAKDQESRRDMELKLMSAEDDFATFMRRYFTNLLLSERRMMTAEDKDGVRKAIKRMPKDARRAYLLEEEEYLRRCEHRDFLREQNRVKLESDLMAREDECALKLRTKLLYAQKFEQHKLTREEQKYHADTNGVSSMSSKQAIISENPYTDMEKQTNLHGMDYNNQQQVLNSLPHEVTHPSEQYHYESALYDVLNPDQSTYVDSSDQNGWTWDENNQIWQSPETILSTSYYEGTAQNDNYVYATDQTYVDQELEQQHYEWNPSNGNWNIDSSHHIDEGDAYQDVVSNSAYQYGYSETYEGPLQGYFGEYDTNRPNDNYQQSTWGNSGENYHIQASDTQTHDNYGVGVNHYHEYTDEHWTQGNAECNTGEWTGEEQYGDEHNGWIWNEQLQQWVLSGDS